MFRLSAEFINDWMGGRDGRFAGGTCAPVREKTNFPSCIPFASKSGLHWSPSCKLRFSCVLCVCMCVCVCVCVCVCDQWTKRATINERAHGWTWLTDYAEFGEVDYFIRLPSSYRDAYILASCMRRWGAGFRPVVIHRVLFHRFPLQGGADALLFG